MFNITMNTGAYMQAHLLCKPLWWCPTEVGPKEYLAVTQLFKKILQEFQRHCLRFLYNKPML